MSGTLLKSKYLPISSSSQRVLPPVFPARHREPELICKINPGATITYRNLHSSCHTWLAQARRARFERLMDKFQRLGLPESIAMIFSSQPDRRSNSKTFWGLHDNNACIKHWFRGNSIKQYNKTGYFLRTETTINNPKSLGLQKPAIYLQAYLWEGVGANDQFLNCCSDVDVSSISEAEHESFTKPVSDHKGRIITAPDFRPGHIACAD